MKETRDEGESEGEIEEDGEDCRAAEVTVIIAELDFHGSGAELILGCRSGTDLQNVLELGVRDLRSGCTNIPRCIRFSVELP